MLGDLTGKMALVTGAAGGLGKGIATVLAQCGADVALADLDIDGAKRAAAEVAKAGRRAEAFQVDVTKKASVQRMVRDVAAEFGKIDVLVNSAGVIGATGYEDTVTSREEDWDATYSVNVKGTVLVSEAVAERMKPGRYGKIVNIASHAGRQGGAGGGAYGASKAAVIHLTQSLAHDLAPYDINVNCICPGHIWTPMWEKIAVRTRRHDPAQRDLTPRQVFERFVESRCPLRREQTPEDMGKMAAFLASEDARNITGQSINVNGGTRMS